jgi:hypothetical protein
MVLPGSQLEAKEPKAMQGLLVPLSYLELVLLGQV